MGGIVRGRRWFQSEQNHSLAVSSLLDELRAHLPLVRPSHFSEHMRRSIRIVDERISLRSMDELEVLCARLTEDGLGFLGHFGGVGCIVGLG